MTTQAYPVDLVRRSGDLERFCDASWRLPSKVDLEEKVVVGQPEAVLTWRPGTKQRRTTRGLLGGFIALRDASPRMIGSFARRAGMLELHDNPIQWAAGKPLPPQDWYESVDDWRMWSAALWAALDIAAHLKAGKRPPASDWQRLFRPAPTYLNSLGRIDPDSAPHWPPSADASILQEQVNVFAEIGKVQPILDFKRGIIRYRVRGLLGALVLQVLLIAAGAESWVICSGCGGPYQPEQRAPKSGQRSFCPACRQQGVPERIAARDYRLRLQLRERRRKAGSR